VAEPCLSLADHRSLAAEASGGSSSEPVYRAFLRVIASELLRGDVLDFGAGKGLLTERIWRFGRFTSLTATDLMQRPNGLPSEIHWIASDLNERSELPGATLDVVLACEILEHLENPRAVAREWFRVLRPGGTLVLSTPNNETWRALIALCFRGHFVAFGDRSYPAHITALLRRDLTRILKEAGFVPPKFLYTNDGGIPRFPKVTWQTISGGLLRGVRFSDNLLAVARKPS
jgi:2-polyprenyl-3-methyl-5-hydroxy-6-metoxy-1,4-benzoquinol methylase